METWAWSVAVVRDGGDVMAEVCGAKSTEEVQGLTNDGKLARLKRELEEAKQEFVRAVQDTWETSNSALKAKQKIAALRGKIEHEQRRLQDKAQGRLSW